MTALPPEIIVFIGAVILISAAVQGLSGFGFALVNVPLLLIVLPPKVVVPLNILLGLGLNAALFLETRHHLKRSQFTGAIAIVAGYSAGAIGGTWLLLALPDSILKVIVYVSMVTFAVWIWRGLKLHIRHENWAATGVGLASGTIGSTTSMGGPPIVLFLAARHHTKEIFRALLSLYGLVLMVIQVGIFAIAGVFNMDIIRLAGILVLAMLAGYWIGKSLFGHIPQDLFRHVVLLIVILTALAGLATLPFEG